jgi:hypothetical protein
MSVATKRVMRCCAFFVVTHCFLSEWMPIQMETMLIPHLDREAPLIAAPRNANVLVADMSVTMLPRLTQRGPEALSPRMRTVKSAWTALLRI